MKKRMIIVCLICILTFSFTACSKGDVNTSTWKVIDCSRKPSEEIKELQTLGIEDLTLIKPLYGDLENLMNKGQEFKTLVLYGDIIVVNKDLLNYFLTKIGNLTIESDEILFELDEKLIPVDTELKCLKIVSDNIVKFNNVVLSKDLSWLHIDAPIEFDIENYAYLKELNTLILKKADIINLESGLFPKAIRELVIEDCVLDQGKAFLEMKDIKGMTFIRSNILDFVKETDLSFAKELKIIP